MEDTRRLLLFDLGGVLIEYTGFESINALLSQEMTADQLRAHWDSTDIGVKFETGAITAAQFGDAFVRHWHLKVTAEVFLTEFRSWTSCLFPGAVELLAELRPRYRLAALSNSNALHWDRNNKELGVDALFERAFSSHEVGMRKPDPAFYRHALHALAVGPPEVVFFDDVFINVEAARGLGIEAHQVVGVDGLRACLLELGILV